ncbi:biotin/lipoyl-binding protein [bacterium 3DAC]|nr:biotin/lipoyl-binding protein [Dictyoglomota bacterium]UZN22933.1 biotin/lipoyl-binding protein [bacterium 3DAC]
MAKKYVYKVKVNGKVYEVEIEEVGGTPVVTSTQRVQTSTSTSASTPAPAPAPTPAQTQTSTSAPTQPSAGGDSIVKAPIPGKVLSIKVKEGDHVEYGQTLLIFEAMKMENEVKAPKAGVVKKIYVSEGANFNTGDPLIEIE